MYPSGITHHFTTGTPILQASSTFYKFYQRITTVNMKNAKAKDGPRSSQISSFDSISPILPFHIKIFPSATSRKCIPRVKDSNALPGMGEVTARPGPPAAPRDLPLPTRLQLSRSPSSWTNSNRKRLCSAHDQAPHLLLGTFSLTQWDRRTSITRA